jgi:predicted naringenin-chalcone synthase
MQRVYAPDDAGRRRLKYLYHKGGIDSRYSVIPDYSLPASEWKFYSPTENLEPFPGLEKRMEWFRLEAAPLSMKAIQSCLGKVPGKKITHLITVSCTGMSAPGLDLELVELLNLPPATVRTSINFMGCYAAIHALRLADAFCRADPDSNVLIVSTELCTLHFQKENTTDNITSSMLFSDGSAAVLVSGNNNLDGVLIGNFYSTVSVKGKPDMAWELSSKGFLMTLSSYVADVIGENFSELVENALANAGISKKDISQWCIHPGGRKILESVHESLGLSDGQLDSCYDVLKDYGNISSPTVLFVLDKILKDKKDQPGKIFTAAFGPGLTMETVLLST